MFRRQDTSGTAWTIGKWHEIRGGVWMPRFHDPADADLWLRGFEPDDLRRAAARCDDSAPLSRMTDNEVVALLAGLIASSIVGVRRADSRDRGPDASSSKPSGGAVAAPTGPAFTPSQLAGRRKEEEVLHWITIELIDADDQPVPGEPYTVQLPDGDIRKGRLDSDGRAHIGGIKVAGQCQVCFPEIDAKEWHAA